MSNGDNRAAGSGVHSQVKIGMRTRILHGKLHPNDDGTYEVKIRYADITDTGATVPTGGGGVKPVVNETSASTTTSVSLGVPVQMGGMQTEKTETTEAGEKTTASKTNFVLTVTEYSNPRADAE